MAFFSVAFFDILLLIGIVMMILLLIGTFVVQVFLSRMKNPWAGWILPGLAFGYILYLCSMTPDFSTAWEGFCIGNIPTVIYLLLYFFVRRRKKKSERKDRHEL